MKAIEALFESLRAAATKGKPLSLKRVAMIIIAISGIVPLYADYGIHEALTGHTHHALLCCGLAALILTTLPIHMYNFLRVKRGVRVPVLNPLPLLDLLRVPLSVKVTLV